MKHLKTFEENNSEEITPELVKSLYKKLNDKQLFITSFGTTKFNVVSQDLLERMYKYLIKKLN